jgi:hypothetical protein
MAKSSVPPDWDPPGDRLGSSEPEIGLFLTEITDVRDPRYAELVERGRQGPDGPDEHLFLPLEDDQPELAERLKRHYIEQWVAEARLRPPSLQDAMDTVELKVAPDEEPGLRRLRLRSFYTGSTYWRYEWDGSEEAAFRFMDQAAELQAWNVEGDREHGPVPWDDVRPPRGKTI